MMRFDDSTGHTPAFALRAKSSSAEAKARPWRVVETRQGANGARFDVTVYRGMDRVSSEAWMRKKGSGWRVWRDDGACPPILTTTKQAQRILRVVAPDERMGLPWA